MNPVIPDIAGRRNKFGGSTMIWCILGFPCFPFNQPLETSSPLSWDDHCAGSQADWSAITQATATWRVWIPHLFRIARSCFKTDPVSPPWGLQVFVTHIFLFGFNSPCWVSAMARVDESNVTTWTAARTSGSPHGANKLSMSYSGHPQVPSTSSLQCNQQLKDNNHVCLNMGPQNFDGSSSLSPRRTY
jgi:hypothetical protein